MAPKSHFATIFALFHPLAILFLPRALAASPNNAGTGGEKDDSGNHHHAPRKAVASNASSSNGYAPAGSVPANSEGNSALLENQNSAASSTAALKKETNLKESEEQNNQTTSGVIIQSKKAGRGLDRLAVKDTSHSLDKSNGLAIREKKILQGEQQRNVEASASDKPVGTEVSPQSADHRSSSSSNSNGATKKPDNNKTPNRDQTNGQKRQ